MNTNATILNNSLTRLSDLRPVSHAAAAVFLGTSVYVAHEGLQSLLPGSLGNVLTALFVAVAVLQWLALGRKEACEDQRDTDRADAVARQALMFGVIETVLYAAGALALASAEGLAAYNWLGVTVATIGAAIFAYSNFKVKWVSCDRVRRPGGRPSFTPTWEILPVEEGPTHDPLPENVVNFDVEKAIREKTARMDAAEAKALAAAPPTRPTAVRLRLAEKRLRTRAWREERKRASA